MSISKNQYGILFGHVAMILLAMVITGISISVWAKPYNSAKDTVNAIAEMASDTTKTLVVTEDVKRVFAESKQVDTLAINAAFLQKMHEKGELLSSNEFASRITDYYNTLVAVLTALFVLFTLVTYITFKSKFEGKFEDKARELEDKQRDKIVAELCRMLSDSKKIDEVIQTAIGGRIDDNIASHEDVDDLSSVVESNGKNIAILMKNTDDLRLKQQELFRVVTELQDQIAEGVIIRQEIGTDEVIEEESAQESAE